jgi:3,4-dihydroxy 2-butanone 4-phosphate synthase/GTP cyclohydrolase II
MSLFGHLVSSRLPSTHGQFVLDAFDSGLEEMPHLALRNDGYKLDVVNIRIHSECITGDLFGSTRCDCGEQLRTSLNYIQENGGVLIYLRQEGRGIGLVNKLKAYNLQDEGYDTIVANHQLGFATDLRSYEAAIAILKYFGIARINLMTNNPEKLEAFENSGIHLESRIPVIISPVADNERYLQTKKDGMGHMI